jgi:hypothetical protein
MLRVSNRYIRAGMGILAFLVFTSVAGLGQGTSGQSSANQPLSVQSLADIARANQQKKAAEGSTTPPKVITNADLPKNPDGYTGPPANQVQDSTPASGDTLARKQASQQQARDQHAAAQWKQQIMAQTNRVAIIETRINRLRAQIYLVDPNAYYDYSAGTAYNAAQARQIQLLKDMEDQLRAQRQRLEAMQEAARHAGMQTTVYDP